MWVWIFMLLSIVVLYFIIPDALGKKKKNLIFLVMSFCIVVYIVGSRSAILTDSSDLYNYYNCYTRALNWSTESLMEFYADRMELGYVLLNKVLATIIPWNYFIVYFEAAFCTGVMFWYIYRNTESVFLSVLVYICIGPWQFFLTGFRQGVAICICFIALELIKRHTFKRDLLAFLLIIFAYFMHTTALIFLFVFLIRRVRLSKKIIIISAICTLFLLLFAGDILAFMNDLLGRKYSQVYRGNEFGGLVPIAIYLGTLLLVYLIWSKDKSIFDKECDRLEVNILFVGLCLYTLRYNTTIFERASFYFTPVISVVLPNAIIRQSSRKLKNIIIAVCVAACIGLFMYRASAQMGEYHFYWEYLERLTTG